VLITNQSETWEYLQPLCKNNVKKNRKKRDKREEIIKNDNNFFLKK
jgi:hypothetical protein